MPYLNVGQYAKHRGVSQSAVSQMISAGKIPREKNGLLDVGVCDAAWPLRADQIAKRDGLPPPQNIPPTPRPSAIENFEEYKPQTATQKQTRSSAEQLTLAMKMAQVSNLRLKNQRIRGELVSRAVAEQLIATLTQVARQRVLAVPVAIGHQLARASTAAACVEIVTRALERALVDTLAAMPDFVAADSRYGE